jgi:hypothetical protein
MQVRELARAVRWSKELFDMRRLIAVVVLCAVAGCGGDAADAPLPASGAAYRALTPGERVAAATACRDRAAAAAAKVASGELAEVDPDALRSRLDVAVTEPANRRRAFTRLCAEHLPFATPGKPIVFDGATDSGDAYTYQTRSDKPLTIRGRLSSAPAGAYVAARREFEPSSSFRGAVRRDGRFTLPTVRLRKQADNSFVVTIHAPPHALRKVRFSAICVDCLASGPASQ